MTTGIDIVLRYYVYDYRTGLSHLQNRDGNKLKLRI